MIQAIYEDTIIAESNNTVIVEGNHYFPKEDVKLDYLVASDHQSTCPWKGEAHYYSVVVKTTNKNAAWYYPEPKSAAEEIRGRIAFWKGVHVIEV